MTGGEVPTTAQAPRRPLPGQLSRPLRTFLGTESGSAGLLLLAAVLALAWANSPWSGGYESLWSTSASVQVGGAELGMDLGHWVNDGLMVVFFFVIGLEVRRELSVGELTQRRRVVVPLLAGIGGMALPTELSLPVDPGRDHVRGPARAPLTLVEYADFECPFCARATGAARELREHFGDELRYVFRHLPMSDVHPHSELAAVAAEAADAQGRFWQMHDLLFTRQNELEREDLIGYAADLDLDVEEFVRDLADEDLAQQVREDVAGAEASGARGTPTFFVDARRHTGPHDARTLTRQLEALRADGPPDLSPDGAG